MSAAATDTAPPRGTRAAATDKTATGATRAVGGMRGLTALATAAETPATSYRAAARRLLHDSLFDAARTLLADRPWAQITMSEVARAAGVSRQTLYKEFGSREHFAQRFVIREGARFLDEVERAIHAHLGDPARAVEAGLEVFLSSAAADPLVRLLLEDDGTGGMLPLVTTRSRPVLEWASARLCEVMRGGWPHVREQDAELLADTFVRLALSYVTMPRDTPHQAARVAATLLGPYVEAAMAGAR